MALALFGHPRAVRACMSHTSCTRLQLPHLKDDALRRDDLWSSFPLSCSRIPINTYQVSVAG